MEFSLVRDVQIDHTMADLPLVVYASQGAAAGEGLSHARGAPRPESGSPAPEGTITVPASARWTGSVVPMYSETYTFHTDTNDGVRLWVDGQLLIDNWVRQESSVDNAGTMTLVAGRAYSIRMEFFEQKGWATARLMWSSARQKKQIIPEAQLRPTLPAAR